MNKNQRKLDTFIDRGLERRGSLKRSFRPKGKKGRLFGQPARKRSFRQVAFQILAILAALFFAGLVAMTIMFAWLAKDLPDPDNIKFRQLAQTTKIYDRTGETVLYEVHGDQKRTVVELENISPFVISATIAAEDRNFYEHGGFSVKGFIRAFIKNTLRGTLHGEGGSTITQQFVKNSILTKEKTYTRKAKELVLSMEMERRFTKDEILKLYLNEIPYGSVIYGIESAAQSYFGKTSKDLTLSEAALLASIPKAATYYSPFGSHRNELVQRSHYVIDTMLELGKITQEEADEAKTDNVLDRLKQRMDSIIAPHFVFHVRELLAEKFGEQAESGGLKVISTLDVDKQRMAEEAITEGMDNVRKLGGSTAALLALNPKNSEILAMVGSADYFDDESNGKFNHIFGYLQPGSSIKPMVYAAAFEKGYTPNTVLYDVSTAFSKSPQEYRPGNYGGKEHGPVTVRKALAGSLNIPAVKTLYLVGLNTFAKQAESLGYTTLSDTGRIGLSLVLGGGEVYPYEHISAYVVFPQEGQYRPPKAILKVEDAEGNVIYDETDPSQAKRILTEQTARMINSILSDNEARSYIFGESNYLTLGERPVCAKTGTTNKYKDSWTIGYTPSLLAGIWAGNSDGSEMKEGSDSSRVAAPIWNSFMRKALEGTPIETFAQPEEIVTGKPVLDGESSTAMKIKIDKMSGKLATEYTPENMIEEIEFSSPHSILHFLDKNDPRGEPPADPSSDPQYSLWEEAIAEWSEKNEIVLRPPPTEYDDVHVPENMPSVRLQSPESNATWSTRQVSLSVYATAPRGVWKVEYLLDGENMTTFDSEPFGGTATVPNHFAKGFHQLTAVAYDDVGNMAKSSAVTINLTAEPGPLNLQWSNLGQNSRIYAYQFPFTIKFRLDDYKAVTELRLTATKSGSGHEEIIGTIDNPPLPNLSYTWSIPPSSGSYALRVEATMSGGAIQSTELMVWIGQ